MYNNNSDANLQCPHVYNNLRTYEMPALSSRDIQELNKHKIKTEGDIYKKWEMNRADVEKKREISRIEVEKTDNLMFLRQELEYAKFEIVEEDGMLYYIRIYCLDESKNDAFSVLPGMHKVCDAKDLKMQRYKCIGDEPEILSIMWDSNAARAILKENNSQELLKVMKKNGIAITVPRRKKSDIFDMLFQYLYKHAETHSIPKFYGWNQTDDGSWKWAGDDEIIYERLVTA